LSFEKLVHLWIAKAPGQIEAGSGGRELDDPVTVFVEIRWLQGSAPVQSGRNQ
jgi:hypothetical protein